MKERERNKEASMISLKTREIRFQIIIISSISVLLSLIILLFICVCVEEKNFIEIYFILKKNHALIFFFISISHFPYL